MNASVLSFPYILTTSKKLELANSAVKLFCDLFDRSLRRNHIRFKCSCCRNFVCM